jgi:rhodanese-related sulfurtransferase
MNPQGSLVNLVLEQRGEIGMFLILSVLSALVLCVLFATRIKRKRDRNELELNSITPEALHTLMASNQGILVFDVRQPLDLLGHSTIIPGAKWIPPEEVIKNPSLIPQEKDAVVYCTCPGDKTSRAVLHQAQALHFSRIKFLKGGLAGWKAKGYPVEPYNEPFHLKTAT